MDNGKAISEDTVMDCVCGDLCSMKENMLRLSLVEVT